MTGPPEVWLDAVTVRYGEVVALRSLTLGLPAGAVTAVTGANGVGKTTLGRVVLGLTAPTSGAIHGAAGVPAAAQFQENRLIGHLGPRENVSVAWGRDAARPRNTIATPPSQPEPQATLLALGIAPDDMGRPVTELSGGQRRRVALARALDPRARLVVLDEPFTGIDAAAKPAVVDAVRERLEGRTVLLITHDAAEAEALGAPLHTLT